MFSGSGEFLAEEKLWGVKDRGRKAERCILVCPENCLRSKVQVLRGFLFWRFRRFMEAPDMWKCKHVCWQSHTHREAGTTVPRPPHRPGDQQGRLSIPVCVFVCVCWFFWAMGGRWYGLCLEWASCPQRGGWHRIVPTDTQNSEVL